jgi:uncharacterized protein YdhG (YjbR/CyaY superfamily)
MKQPNSIDEYIGNYPEEARELLEAVRQTIRTAAPEASEKISYGIPTFYLNGNLVHFAAFKDHFSFFPTSSGTKAFASELDQYDTTKGTIRFPLDKPLPHDLIRRIVEYRVKENLAKKK